MNVIIREDIFNKKSISFSYFILKQNELNAIAVILQE